MPRPKLCRRVCQAPAVTSFRPASDAGAETEEVILLLDELEAMRLVDMEGLYQDAAAGRMGISRRTFGRIIESGRGKVTRALVRGLRLRIEGGPARVAEVLSFRCGSCRHAWEQPTGEGPPVGCPHCHGPNVVSIGAMPGPVPSSEPPEGATPLLVSVEPSESGRDAPGACRCCRRRRRRGPSDSLA